MVSIVTPIYNIAPWLSRCLESILAQTYTDWELVLVDDGSSDRSAEIASRYADRDARIRFFQRPHQGAGAARNYGMQHAKGQFVTFVDGDDYLHHQSLRLMVEALRNGSCDMALIGVKKTDEQMASFTSYHEESVRRLVLSQHELLMSLFRQNMQTTWLDAFATWGKMVRRELLEGLTFKDSGIFEDLLFNTQLFLRCTRGGMAIHEDLYFWFQRDDSTTHDMPANQLQTALERLEQTYDMLPANQPQWQLAARRFIYPKMEQALHYELPSAMQECIGHTIREIYQRTQHTLVSVVVTAYQLGEKIDACMESICRQTYRDLDIILIDDGSTDETPQRCDQWQSQDARITVIHQPHVGYATARNVGLERMKGDYLLFVDGDDAIHPQAVSVLLQQAMATGADLVMGQTKSVYEHGEKERRLTVVNKRPLTTKDIIDGIYVQRIPEQLAVWNKLYRRELAEGLRFRETASEDMVFSTETALRMKRGLELDCVLYHYLQHTGNVTAAPLSQRTVDILYSAWLSYELIPPTLRQYRKTVLLSLYGMMAKMKMLTKGSPLQDYCKKTCRNLKRKTWWDKQKLCLFKGKLRF